ncbi:alpha/beta fold hydrolase [Pseudodonghicola flavimaris]|uniref:Alpha/beta fold hydrolase n=1 Tax=Pseudodonghicola flavimaris TaxID=3050036 RepID=A0ABT7F0C8_9RHOB|nr:alpha/beta fold hydrolase [Pseudodonghicola flavimaris]MDK3018058.1 alpha/beta fold hydrolase [Pseudodonghicola flavimaris]
MTLDYEIFDLGTYTFQCGLSVPDCKLAYKTFGTLNEGKDNVIVYPTWYSGQHYDNEWLIGPGMALDPEKYFIIIPNMFGNGLSSSPSNTPEPYNADRFPNVTAYDNVVAQHRLLTEKFGITKIRMVTGWSMGALQTFHWGALFPDMMDLIAPFCGSAKCSRHNYVFLEGVKAALRADAAWENGRYTSKPEKGLRAVGRVYAGWGLSQTFYREELDLKALGYASLEDFLIGFWEGFFLPKDANNLLTMAWTWQHGDISDNELYNGDFKAALAAIKAKAYVMPGQTDLYFPPEDSQNEVANMPDAEFVPVPSIWGHFAGGPGTNPEDVKFIDDKLKELLAS